MAVDMIQLLCKLKNVFTGVFRFRGLSMERFWSTDLLRQKQRISVNWLCKIVRKLLHLRN